MRYYLKVNAIDPNFNRYTKYENTNDFYSIYDLILFITGSQRTAKEVACWAEDAPKGDKYDTDEFTAEIIYC